MCPSLCAQVFFPLLSLWLSSYPLCLLRNGKWRISGGFLTPLPSETNGRQKATVLVIILSHGPRPAHLLVSPADKAFQRGFVSLLSVRGDVPKVTATPPIFSFTCCKQKKSGGYSVLFRLLPRGEVTSSISVSIASLHFFFPLRQPLILVYQLFSSSSMFFLSPLSCTLFYFSNTRCACRRFDLIFSGEGNKGSKVQSEKVQNLFSIIATYKCILNIRDLTTWHALQRQMERSSRLMMERRRRVSKQQKKRAGTGRSAVRFIKQCRNAHMTSLHWARPSPAVHVLLPVTHALCLWDCTQHGARWHQLQHGPCKMEEHGSIILLVIQLLFSTVVLKLSYVEDF